MILLWLCGTYSANAQDHAVALVVSTSNATINVSSPDLRKIFAGEKRSWPNGTPVKLVVSAPGTSERLALLRLLRMTETEYKMYWTGRVYRGESDSEPLLLPSVGMIVEAARLFPGTVALVEVQDLRPGMPIKIIRVDGKLPGESGYPLH